MQRSHSVRIEKLHAAITATPDVTESRPEVFLMIKTRLWRPEFVQYEYTHANSSANTRRMRNEMFPSCDSLELGPRLLTREGTELVTAKIHICTR